MLRYDVATPWEGMEGDWAASALYAGASAVLVREVEAVGAVLARIEAEAGTALRRALPQ